MPRWMSSAIYHVEASLNVMAHAQITDFVFRVKRTSHFKSVVASVQSTTGRRVVRISGSNELDCFHPVVYM